jgi:hypothetical protein
MWPSKEFADGKTMREKMLETPHLVEILLKNPFYTITDAPGK